MHVLLYVNVAVTVNVNVNSTIVYQPPTICMGMNGPHINLMSYSVNEGAVK